MALRESEAIVLRTYPLREADLLVTLFTRVEGKAGFELLLVPSLAGW